MLGGHYSVEYVVPYMSFSGKVLYIFFPRQGCYNNIPSYKVCFGIVFLCCKQGFVCGMGALCRQNRKRASMGCLLLIVRGFWPVLHLDLVLTEFFIGKFFLSIFLCHSVITDIVLSVELLSTIIRLGRAVWQAMLSSVSTQGCCG